MSLTLILLCQIFFRIVKAGRMLEDLIFINLFSTEPLLKPISKLTIKHAFVKENNPIQWVIVTMKIH